MFLLRSVTIDDIDALYELSKLVSFINLPPDKKIIEEKVKISAQCFTNPGKDLKKNYYFFVLEDVSKSKLVGVSMIHAQHGTEEEPHFFLKVEQEHKYSETIQTGFVHGTLKLGQETNGPSEIGGLVLHPDYRGKPGKLGKQLSFVRFLYIGMNKGEFKEVIHSELMPPLDQDGNSPLWEAIGRKFMNMDYQVADKLSLSNKEFITNLFPSETIYVPLLPVMARNAIGKVGDDTQPVKKMLEGIGFKYMNEIDPFDGGPHYRCKVEDIEPIKNLSNGKVRFTNNFDTQSSQKALLTIPSDHSFAAIFSPVIKDENKNQYLIPDSLREQFHLPEEFNSHLMVID